MVREAMDINERLNLYHRLNPHQQRAARERRSEPQFLWCAACRRYRWTYTGNTGRRYCRECGCLVEKGG
jgi:hypothetical protein